jgi:hypothetical protein
MVWRASDCSRPRCCASRSGPVAAARGYGVQGAARGRGRACSWQALCYSRRMKLVVIVLALMLGGCGQTKEPFVGTWHEVGYDPGSGMAISKVSGVYRVALVAHFKPQPGYSWLFSRRGTNELFGQPGQFQGVEVIKFNPASGRLTWTENGVAPEEFSKVSGSTAPPTPWPTTSP